MFFLSILLLLLFASFPVLLNGLYPNPQVLPFLSDSLPQPTGGGGGEGGVWGRWTIERLPGSLLPARAKP